MIPTISPNERTRLTVTGATAAEVFRFLAEQHAAGHKVCLATITYIEGSSPRLPGTVMGISDDGVYAGSFSGGCIEAAVVGEALDAIHTQSPRLVRFGAGSPYIDVRLPCGGGVDILFQTHLDHEVLTQVNALLDTRMPVLVEQDLERFACKAALDPRETGWADERFSAWYAPALRVVLLGNGTEVLTTAALAKAYGADVVVAAPDAALTDAAESIGASALLLHSADGPLPKMDAWTAALLFFHDHDWDAPVLERLVGEPAFFIGAMGSHRTQQARLAELRAMGVGEAALARIHSPLGLMPSARDPSTLALSALAQVVTQYRGLVG